MMKKGIVGKLTGGLVTIALTTMFALPTFAAGYSPVNGSAGDTSFSGRVYINWNGAGAYLQTTADADLSVSGKAKDEYGNYKAFGASASQTTYVGSHIDGVYTYANATFTVISNDDGYNKVYANYLD